MTVDAARSTRAVVTGVGLLSPAGTGLEALGRVLADDEACLEPVPPGAGGGLWGRIDDEELPPLLPGRRFRRLPRFTRLVLAAARLAVESAGFGFFGPPLGNRTGIFLGTSRGPLEAVEEMSVSLVHGGVADVKAIAFQETVFNAAVGRLSIQLGVGGPAIAFSSGRASGLDALAVALLHLQSGRIDRALVGGVDTLSRRYRRALADLGVLAPSAAAPFAADRRGFVASEGAVFLVVEPRALAVGRGAEPWVEVEAVSAAADAHSSYGNEPSGAGFVLAVRRALAAAALDPQEVQLVFAAASGEVELDGAEAAALTDVWGSDRPPVAAIKANTGDMGAASGLASIALAGCLRRSELRLPTWSGGDSVLGRCADLRCRLPEANVVLVDDASWGGVNSAAVVRLGAPP